MTTAFSAPEKPGNSHSILARRALQSGSALLASAPLEEQKAFLDALSNHDLQALPWLFDFWALPHQLPPEGAWRTWVIMGGRGAGKTRAGSEWVRMMVEGDMPMDVGQARRVALVGETFDQVRDIMVFGDSGIIACSPPDRRPTWNASKRRLEWQNGAVAEAHSASSPEGLRGPQFDAAWVDELGCAAIDKGTNQPNKFLDPKSSESSVPYFSNGRRDDYVQMQYLRAYFSYFDEPSHNPVSSLYAGPMVDMSRAFVWAWDGRPWPDFPNNTGLWSDGPNYTHGHWLNGRTGVQPLAAVVAHICEASGLQNYDVSQLHGVLRGYSFNDIQSARASLQPLMVTYGFDAIERGGVVVFRNRETASEVSVSSETFVVQDGAEAVASHVRAPEAEVVGQVRLGYVEAEGEFVPRVAEARFPDETVPVSTQNDLQLALTPGEARAISERWLSEARVARDSVKLTLPPSCHSVSAGDVLRLEDETQTSALWRIDRIENREGCSVEAVRMEREVYEPSQEIEELSEIRPFSQALPMEVQFLDLPLLRGTEDPVAPYVAATSKPWPGGAAIYGSFEDTDYQLNTVLEQSATMGVTLSDLQAGETGLWDRGAPLTVKLANGALSSASRSAVLNGANLFAIGDGSTGNWELVQFTTANLVAPATYELSDRLRGQAGSDGNVPDIWPSGSRVIFLTSAVQQLEYDPSLRGLDRHFRVGPAGKSYVDPVYRHYVRRSDGIGLRPYAPCHLRARASGGDLSVSWIRRTRIDGDSWQSVEVPLNEASEAYVVRVLNAGGVLRETEVHAPNWIYTADMRAVDGPVTAIEVAQISQSFGPGPFIRKEFDV